jgi:hypothetical protein
LQLSIPAPADASASKPFLLGFLDHSIRRPRIELIGLITAYAAARLILSVLAATPLIPATWRAIVATLVLALDQLWGSFPDV